MSFADHIKQLKPSWILVLTFIAVTWVNFNQEPWKGRSVLAYDVMQYYSYLPVVFYEQDLSQSFLNDTANSAIERKYYAANMAPNGNHVFKMSMGMAFTYLPFFGLAHVYTAITGNDRERGFSEPYHFAIRFSSLFYFLAGLFFLIKVLRLFFRDRVITLTLLCLAFGTNAFYYATMAAGMSHATSFGLMAAFLYYCVRWHQAPTYRDALLVGCLGGLLTLIRPINILVYVFFFLYDVRSVPDLRRKGSFLISHSSHVLILALCGVLFFLPQLLYWKYISGQYFFNSYVDEHFYFNRPQIINGLFSFRKGWLLYTPMMLLALAGIFFLKEKLQRFSVALVGFLAIYVYVVFSWWCWWYGGSFGQRPMIDVYPLLSVPLAALICKAMQSASFKRNIIYSLIALFVLLNLFQSMQAKYNIIHYDSNTRENYFREFFSITKKPDREKYLKHPDYDKAMQGEREY